MFDAQYWMLLTAISWSAVLYAALSYHWKTKARDRQIKTCLKILNPQKHIYPGLKNLVETNQELRTAIIEIVGPENLIEFLVNSSGDSSIPEEPYRPRR